MLVYGHPDDETVRTGATMAKYAAEGAHVTLVTCTLGDEGEIVKPELAHLAADREDRLGLHRICELADACRALGVTDHRFLIRPGRWRDSGMIGTPANDDPRSFWRADVDEAARALVEIIREVRPQVMITFDERGYNGHPDHIQAHRVAMRAFEKANVPGFGAGIPWEVGKIYATIMPYSAMVDRIRAVEPDGDAEGDAGRLPFVVADETVAAEIDARDYAEHKHAAMAAHASQMDMSDPYLARTETDGWRRFGTEHYALLGGRRAVLDRLETDLFEGVDTGAERTAGTAVPYAAAS
jgi:N-acetyl-1-D-myo-inositol-2-amino-2-deoxy-alpha-D-glucopyranoside deacetylase